MVEDSCSVPNRGAVLAAEAPSFSLVITWPDRESEHSLLVRGEGVWLTMASRQGVFLSKLDAEQICWPTHGAVNLRGPATGELRGGLGWGQGIRWQHDTGCVELVFWSCLGASVALSH